MTAPYPAGVDELLSRDMRHGYAVTAKPLAGPEVQLDVDQLRVQFSEDWSPHIQATFTTRIPLDQVTLDALDPRKGCRVEVTAGYIYPGDKRHIHPLADLHFRGRDVSRPENELALAASSDEARAQDYLKMWPGEPPLTGVKEAVTWLAARAVAPEVPTIVSAVPAGTGAASLAGLETDIGADHWSIVADVAARTGLWVYCDGARTWRVATKPTLAGVPAYALETGQRGTITRSRSSLSRETWYNAAVLKYSWRDGAGNDQVIYGRAQVSSGEYAVAAVGYRTYYQEIPMAASQAQADAVAAARVRNLVTRGRSLDITAANAAYWLRPGATIQVQLPTGDPEAHLVSSITFDPPAGTMDIQTRQPLNVTITTGE